MWELSHQQDTDCLDIHVAYIQPGLHGGRLAALPHGIFFLLKTVVRMLITAKQNQFPGESDCFQCDTGWRSHLGHRSQRDTAMTLTHLSTISCWGALDARPEPETKQAELSFLAPPVRRAKQLRLSQPWRLKRSSDTGVWRGFRRRCQ